MSTSFDIFPVGADVQSLEHFAEVYERGELSSFGSLDGVRDVLSSFSCSFHPAGPVVDDSRCAWKLDLAFSIEAGEVSSIAVYVVPRIGSTDSLVPLGTLIAEVAAALGGSAFDRQSGERVGPL